MILIEGYSVALASTQSASSGAGSEAAAGIDLAALVETYSALLFRVAHSVVRSPSEAEDVVQDVFLRVLQHHLKAKNGALPAVRDLRVWLVRIAWNLALDRRRRIRPSQIDDAFAASLIASTVPADQVLHGSQRMQTVLHELDRLPKVERQVLLLSALDELSTPELAAITGRTESAVRALLFRARTRLRQRLDQGGRA
jgi:RNA polymerase sigma-70 factor (ECF subfamily)